MTWDLEVDAEGLLCPLPVLKLRKALTRVGVGQVVRMRADDPAALVDVPHFCAEAGHGVLEQSEDAGVLVFLVRKGG